GCRRDQRPPLHAAGPAVPGGASAGLAVAHTSGATAAATGPRHAALGTVVGQLVELLGRDPQFEDRAATRLLDGTAAQEVRLDLEAGHEAGAVVLDVPVPGDPDRVVLVENGIEDRLLGQPRRPGLFGRAA